VVETVNSTARRLSVFFGAYFPEISLYYAWLPKGDPLGFTGARFIQAGSSSCRSSSTEVVNLTALQ